MSAHFLADFAIGTRALKNASTVLFMGSYNCVWMSKLAIFSSNMFAKRGSL